MIYARDCKMPEWWLSFVFSTSKFLTFNDIVNLGKTSQFCSMFVLNSSERISYKSNGGKLHHSIMEKTNRKHLNTTTSTRSERREKYRHWQNLNPRIHCIFLVKLGLWNLCCIKHTLFYFLLSLYHCRTNGFIYIIELSFKPITLNLTQHGITI